MGRKAGLPSIYKRPDSEIYWCAFTVAGKRYRIPTGKSDAGEAEEAARQIHAEITLGRPAPARKRLSEYAASGLDVLIAEFCVWARANKSPLYAVKIEGHMARFGRRWQRLHQATDSAEIERYKLERLDRDRISTVTLHKELVSLSRFFHWCKKVRKVLPEIPYFDRVRPVSDYVPPNLSRADVDEILAELPDRRTHRKRCPVREFYSVQWDEGMRPGQPQRLRWSDIDFANRQIFIRQSNDKARSEGRYVAMGDIAYAVLSNMAELPHLPDGLIFGACNYRASLDEAIKRVNQRRAKEKRPAVPHVTAHHFRHARLTELAGVTKDTAAIQALAGHKSLATTDKYVRSRVERQASVLAAASAAARKGTPKPRRRSDRAPRLAIVK